MIAKHLRNNMPEDGKEKVLGERDFIFSIVRKYINENSNPKNTAIFLIQGKNL